MEDYLKAHDQLGQLLGKNIVFVVGATRWGTSWVQQCLDTHPNICCKGEGHFTDSLFPSLAKLIDQYNQDAEKIGNRMQLAGLPGNAAGFTFDDVEHLMRTAMALMFQRWIGDQENITCIGEKTPEHVLSLELLDKLFPEMRIIHVVRDGRDEAASAWDFNMGISKGEFPRRYPSFADFAETFARNWSRSVGSARGLAASIDGAIIKSGPRMLSKSPHRSSAACSGSAVLMIAKTTCRRLSSVPIRSHH